MRDEETISCICENDVGSQNSVEDTYAGSMHISTVHCLKFEN